MPDISLQPITVDNWKACINLRLNDEQEGFLPSNLYSLAESQFYPDARRYAIYSADHHMVGFVLYGKEVTSGAWKIFRLMIDRAFQQRGYGTATMYAVLERIAAEPGSDAIRISYQRANTPAARLYQRLGFVECEEVNGKVTAVLTRRHERTTAPHNEA